MLYHVACGLEFEVKHEFRVSGAIHSPWSVEGPGATDPVHVKGS